MNDYELCTSYDSPIIIIKENPKLKLRKNEMLWFHFVINQEQEKCIKTRANLYKYRS